MRRIILYIVQRFYKEKFHDLSLRLLKEYEKVKHNENLNYNILSKLLISGEDHRFFYHIGFDVIAILRAFKNRIFLGRIEGASTIEQQLVRVLTNKYEKTISRKMQEILLASTLASLVPRKALPSIYINIAYYGTGMHGLSQALNILNIESTEVISLEQAAEIVSRIKYPQPKEKDIKRLNQIENRKHHLILLYRKHLKRKFIKIYG